MDLLTQFPNGDYEPPNEEVLGDAKVMLHEEKKKQWQMAFDGSSMERKVGPRIVLKPPKGE